MRLTISRSMVIFGAIVCSGFMIVVGLSGVALGQLKVTGPLYSRIASGKDLLGDILPPPEYVVEAYLEANLAAQDPESLAAHEARLATLRRDYEQRRAYWQASLIPADLKQELTVASDAQVRRFWDQLDTAVVPAIRRRDTAAIASAMGELGRTYLAHRRLIDDVVAKATAMDAQNERTARTLVARYTGLMFGGAGLVAVVLVAGLIAIGRRVTRPIASMKTYMGALAGGDYSRAPPFADRTDEIGEMAASVAVFRTAVLERQAARQAEEAQAAEAVRTQALAEAERVERGRRQAAVVDGLACGLERLSAGDLTFRLSQPFADDYERLRLDFNRAMQALQETLDSVSASVALIGGGAGEVALAVDDLSGRTEHQAASLEQTAAALEQITATVRRTAEGASQARGAVGTAKQDAERSGQVVREAVAAMGDIETAAHQIGDIIGVIDEIAFQTNLLALNAGVEAARAGDAGRGFAVVASEVRALAQRSALAAKEIKDLVSQSVRRVDAGVALVGQTGTVLHRIIAQVGDIDVTVTEIAASAQEQAAGLLQVNTAVSGMDRITQQNAAMVEQSAAATVSLKTEAERLAALVAHFDVGEERTARPRGGVPQLRLIAPPVGFADMAAALGLQTG